MPRLPFDAFSKQLKRGEIPPAIYLYGEENALKEEAVRAVIDRVLDPALRDFNLDQRSAADLDAEAVVTVCTTLPMMAERRIVVIKDMDACSRRGGAKSAMLRYLEKPVPETILLLVDGRAGPDPPDADLGRLATAVNVERLPARLAEKWVQKRADERGFTLTPEAAAHLVRAVQADLGAARSELEKLAGLSSGKPIELDQLAASLGVRRGETASDWCDAVLQDRTGEAAAMLPMVLTQPGVSGVALLAQLGTQLIGLGATRARYESGARGPALKEAAKSLLFRARPGRFDYHEAAVLWCRVIEQWPMPRITAAIRAARHADVRLKGTTLADERGVLLDFLMQISPLAGVTG
ncbi:MAG: DNA polymerase III subunit delta [Gemmatimonadales bacterium]